MGLIEDAERSRFFSYLLLHELRDLRHLIEILNHLKRLSLRLKVLLKDLVLYIAVMIFTSLLNFSSCSLYDI